MSPEADKIKEAKVKASRYCAGGEKSPNQVFNKLIKYGLSGNEADKVIQELISSGFINEKRFACAFCNDKLRFNKWGRLKIKLELQKHQISTENIEIGLASIDESEYVEIMRALMIKKSNELKKITHPLSKQKKLCDSMILKGFEYYKIMNEYESITSSN